MNYFEFYNIPMSFRVDIDVLKQIYYQNSKQFHPDRFAASGDMEAQEKALEISTLNNEAFKTLSDPELRMQYLLRCLGALDEDAAQKETLPQDFLMEMMDINESLMELEFDFDLARFQSAQNQVANIENELNEGIEKTLQNYIPGIENPDALKKIKDYYFKRKYLLRIRENLSKFAPA